MKDFLRNLLARRHCVMGTASKLHRTARIVNILGRREAISIGAGTHVRGELLTFAHGGSISIGRHCYIGEGSRIWSAGRIRIGDHVLVSHDVTILDNLTHPLGARARREHFRQIALDGHPARIDLGERPVEIHDDAWIGCMSVILRGVVIGEGAIIGAGSVVTESVAPYTIVAGNPARPVRELGPDER